MKIGIVSDSHGRRATVTKALDELRRRGIELVLHCGDIDEPGTVLLFHGFEAHFVFGNCDGDRDGLRRAAAQIGAKVHEPFGHLELENKQIAMLHGDDVGLLRDLVISGAFDYLFCGHTHIAEDRIEKTTRIINPGALHRARPHTFAILDLASGKRETVPVEA